jgi:hypothetical protein
MRKVAVLGALITVASSTPASARIHEPFTLAQAHVLVARYERGSGIRSHVGPCRWATFRHRRASCAMVSDPLTVVVGQAPARYAWSDIVTRAGACTSTIVRRTGPHSGVATAPTPETCFAGPLVAYPAGPLVLL